MITFPALDHVWSSRPETEKERCLIALVAEPSQRSASQYRLIDECWKTQLSEFAKWQDVAECFRLQSNYKIRQKELMEQGIYSLQENDNIPVLPYTFDRHRKNLFDKLPFQAVLLSKMPFPEAIQMYSKLIQLSIVGKRLLHALPAGLPYQSAFLFVEPQTLHLAFLPPLQSLMQKRSCSKTLRQQLDRLYENSFMKGFKQAFKISSYVRRKEWPSRTQIPLSICFATGKITLDPSDLVKLFDVVVRRFEFLYKAAHTLEHRVMVSRAAQKVALRPKDWSKLLIPPSEYLFKASFFNRFTSVTRSAYPFSNIHALAHKKNWALVKLLDHFNNTFPEKSLTPKDLVFYKTNSVSSSCFEVLINYPFGNDCRFPAAFCQAKVTVITSTPAESIISISLINDIVFSPFISKFDLDKLLTSKQD